MSVVVLPYDASRALSLTSFPSCSFWILPIVTLLFLLNFIDRSAVGNANVGKLSKLTAIDQRRLISLRLQLVSRKT